MNSSTLAPLQDAYAYTLLYLNYNGSNPTHTSAVFNVTGTQIVHGNWTEGYNITYTNNELVNVSATLANSPNYEVNHIAQYPLSDRNYTVTYTPQQQEIILAALSNGTVRSDLAGIQYYVSFVSPAFNGITEVDFFQINAQGPRGLAVDLSAATLEVVQISS